MSTGSLPGNIASRFMPSAKYYDLLACSPLIVWYSLCLMKQVPDLAQEVTNVLLPQSGLLPTIDVLSKLSVLVFAAVLIFMLVARRPAAAKTRGIFPRVAAFFGAYLGVGILTLPRHPLAWEFNT